MAETAVPTRVWNRNAAVLAALAIGAAAAAAAFMTIGSRGNWDFVLPFRAAKLAGMIVVAYSIAISTVLFQTITQNRILTPAIMGFDQLFIAVQTALVFFIGAGALAGFDPRLRFAGETLIMVVLSVLLFYWLFLRERRSLHLVVLAGIVFGVFFRSLSHMLQRILEPNEFSVLQDMMLASFNSVEGELIAVAAAIVLAVSILGWRLLRTFDVLALGREISIGLGLDYERLVLVLFAMIALLVSVSTALVGPVTFLGLLVANLAYQALGSERHRRTLPAATLIAIIAIVGGQTILEHLFALDTALGIIVEFVGGITFIWLLLRRAYA